MDSTRMVRHQWRFVPVVLRIHALTNSSTRVALKVLTISGAWWVMQRRTTAPAQLWSDR